MASLSACGSQRRVLPVKEVDRDNLKWPLEGYPMLTDWRANSVKISLFPKAVYRFNAIPVNIAMALFSEVEQLNPSSIRDHKKDPE